jgi:hypothetical protein
MAVYTNEKIKDNNNGQFLGMLTRIITMIMCKDYHQFKEVYSRVLF